MSKKYHSKETICIEAPGLSIEFDVAVAFTVTDYSPMTLTSPEEPCMVEDVDLTVTRGGKVVSLPVWLIEEITSDESFRSKLLEEAGEADLVAAEDYADYRREMREER